MQQLASSAGAYTHQAPANQSHGAPREFRFGVCRNSTLATIIVNVIGAGRESSDVVEVHVSFQRGGKGGPTTSVLLWIESAGQYGRFQRLSFHLPQG